MPDRPPGSRNALAWAGGGAVIAVATALTALLVVLLLDGRERSSQGPGAPALSRALTLRAAPDEDAEAVAPVRLEAGVPVLVSGRSADGGWLLLQVPGRATTGWAPADAVVNAGELSALPVIKPSPPPTAAPSLAAAAGPPQTPDLPDLAIEAAFSRQNRLVVIIANVGNSDIDGAVFVVVDEGEPQRVDVSGKPLRSGETLEAVLEEEYVQRRATVTIEVHAAPGVEEADVASNRLQAVITPDVPNDLEVLSVELDSDELDPELARFGITLRNNSVIPLVGAVTIAVRRAAPDNVLIGSFAAQLEIEAGGTQLYEREFDLASGEPPLDLASIQVILSSDAINDANSTNNVFPR